MTLHPPGFLDRPPRVARAYLAGFGTSGSLLMCLALMFIVVSALVAFRGWPQVGAQPSPGEVVVSAQPAAAPDSAAARRLVLVSTAPVSGAGGPAALVAPRVGVGRRGPAAHAVHQSIGRPASSSVPAPAPAGVHQITQTATGGAHKATGALGKVVGATGKTASTAVQQTTNTAAGAVQAISPPAAGVVKSAGSGTATLSGGLTQTAAGAPSGLGGG